ncbi:hypothetical protein EC957_009105 [Mortierella hygrophila]|uniref:Uncharacterized protein n=1 Tax=Mortierella hygrophila TaxID=979708 RepID=A0A9P6FBI0_9FUNG|nr:hypothetical protein EC957_009105 [Mortierella hygrophila]
MNKEMDAAELRAINKLLSTAESMTEVGLVRKLAEARRDAISDDERRILDHLCEHIKPKEDNSENGGDCDCEDNGDIDDKNGAEQLYNPPRSRGEIDVQIPFTPTNLVRSVSGQLALELKKTYRNGTFNLHKKISVKEPGHIIKYFICDVAPQGLTSRQRKKAGHRTAVRLLSLNEIGAHLDVIKDKHLDPSQYKERGYLLRSSIRTNGFRVQLLAFKLGGLPDIRYRRLPENCLPPRLTSTVGGTDYYLQEIRNVITSKEDIERLCPGINIEDIGTLTLDAGHACVIGGFAHLPTELSTESKDKEPVKSDLPMGGVMVANQ